MTQKNKLMRECMDNSSLISRHISQNNKHKLKEIDENMVYLRDILSRLLNKNEKEMALEKILTIVNNKVKKMLKIFENEDKWQLERYMELFDIDYIVKILLNEISFQYLEHKENIIDEIKDEQAKKFWMENFGRKNLVKKR